MEIRKLEQVVEDLSEIRNMSPEEKKLLQRAKMDLEDGNPLDQETLAGVLALRNDYL